MIYEKIQTLRILHRGCDLPVCDKDSPDWWKQYSEEDCQIVIIGNARPPGSGGNQRLVDMQTDTCVIGIREAGRETTMLPMRKKVCIVSQTTFNYNKFQELVEIINKKRL